MSEYSPSMDGIRTGYPERGELVQAVTYAPYTPSTGEVRRRYAYARSDRPAHKNKSAVAEFDRWRAEHVASQVERLAREFGMAQISGFFLGPEGYAKAWLDAKAAEIREGKTND